LAIAAEMVRRPTGWTRADWLVSGAALFYLHYTTGLLLAAEIGFYALIVLLRPRWAAYRWTSALMDLVILAALCLPAVGHLQAIFARRANWELFVERTPLIEALDWWPYPRVVSAGLLAVAVTQLVWLMVAEMPSHGTAEAELARAGPHAQDRLFLSALLVCWVVIPLVAAWLATQTNVARVFFPRYLAAVLPGVALLSAFLGTSLQWKWLRRLAGVALVGIAAWPMIDHVRKAGRVIDVRGEDLRGCAAWMNKQLQATDYPVLVFSGLIEADELRGPHDELLEDYCLAPVNSLYPLDIDRGDMFPLALHNPGKLDQVAEMLVVHRGGAWLIVHGDKKTGARIADEITTHLRAAAIGESSANWRIKDSQTFGNVQALLLAADGNDLTVVADPSVAGP